jgi:ClpP class serine protease
LLTLSINSVEGSIVSTESIIESLKSKSKSLQIPFYTFAQTYALGPAFILLSSGDKSFANPHSIIGGLSSNITTVGLVKLLEKWKVKSTNISTAPTRLDPFQKITSQDEAWAQSQLKHRQKILNEFLLRQNKGASVIFE